MRGVLLFSIIAVALSAAAGSVQAQQVVPAEQVPPGSRVFPGQVVAFSIEIAPGTDPAQFQAYGRTQIELAAQAATACSLRTVRNTSARTQAEQAVLFRGCIAEVSGGTLYPMGPDQLPCLTFGEHPDRVFCVIFTRPSFAAPSQPSEPATTQPPPQQPRRPSGATSAQQTLAAPVT